MAAGSRRPTGLSGCHWQTFRMRPTTRSHAAFVSWPVATGMPTWLRRRDRNRPAPRVCRTQIGMAFMAFEWFVMLHDWPEVTFSFDYPDRPFTWLPLLPR